MQKEFMNSHRIRLRGPWQVTPLEESNASGLDQESSRVGGYVLGLPLEQSQSVPGDWGDYLGASFRGRVRYTRTFSWPHLSTNPACEVYLVVEKVRTSATICLNHQVIGHCYDQHTARLLVSEVLQLGNQLEIDVEHLEGSSSLAGGIVGEVYLEIRE